MILINKNVGETPLELIDRIRLERPELRDEKLSYAGRLDPMAEGEMMILVGDENKYREKILGLDKEYVATFLLGVKTDSGDILGLIDDSNNHEKLEVLSDGDLKSVKEKIEINIKEFLKIKEQKYPWFSGQTVDGIKLFDHYKAGNTEIERPTRKVEIKKVELLNVEELDGEEIKKYIFDSIAKVSGDFRQKEILVKWREFFDEESGFAEEKFSEKKMFVCEIKILVSSGTYIRALTENFDFPTTLLKLNRTKILINSPEITVERAS